MPTTGRRPRRTIAALIASGALVVTGLIAPTATAAEPDSSGWGRSARFAAPTIGACYSYKKSTLDEVSSSAPAIACTAKHTAETYYEGTLPDSFGLPSKAAVAKRISAGEPCTVKAMNAYLGIPDRKLPSRFQTAVLFPTDAQWQAGERWMRCDVVLQGGTSLVTLTKPAAEVVASAPAEQFDFCTPGTPNAKNTSAFPCNKPKVNWIKVLDKELGAAGSSFPGTRSVESRTRSLCKAQGKVWNGKEKYPGWWAIWPTAKGWKEGRRSAQCFVPYTQYQAELAQRAPAPEPATPETASAPAS